MKRITYVFVLLTIALIAFPVITYRNMTLVDGPSGPEPVDMDRCDSDDDYFNTNELECEEIFSIFLVFPSAILFLLGLFVVLQYGKAAKWVVRVASEPETFFSI